MEPDENGLVCCDKCKGEGKSLVPGKQIDEYTYMAVFKLCDKCGGEGKLDWISMVMGKKRESFPDEDELQKLLNEDDLEFADVFDEAFSGKNIKLITGMKYEPQR